MSEHSVLSALVRSVLDAAASLGADVDAIVAEAGIDRAALDDPDARIPLDQDVRVWELLARRGDGLAIGARLGLAGMGVVGYAMQHGATVGEALAWQQRFAAVIHPDVVPAIEHRDDPAGRRFVFVRPTHPRFAPLREPVYAQIAALVATLRALSGRDVRPAFVQVALPRPTDPSPIEAFLGCPVGWGAPRVEVAFDAALLDVPLPRADPTLFSYLARRAEALRADLPADASWADRARREIGALLARGEPRLAAVARQLGVSERTLHRRLDEEGTGFAALVDDARRERATLLLADRSLSASQVAFLLGYAEPAAFFRAFKRWTGETPQAWRRAR